MLGVLLIFDKNMQIRLMLTKNLWKSSSESTEPN
jgi:hypothetical protein